MFNFLERATRGALGDADLDAESIEVAHIGNFVGELTGFQAINPSGGLLGLGHPVGATGVWMRSTRSSR